ncbi:MAG: DUF2071 domain-containing protein [Candidatus Poseidoniaceae archaeon]|jgi:hypothetical protein|nr:DUF2071 domain-containing protein [Candidatus Poseidoniaceae archaeon]
MGREFRRDHLPFEMPKRAYSLSQQWRYLSFMHWEIDPEKLANHLPDGLELDLFDGKAYVGTIPFLMKGVRPRLLPSVYGISTFPEFNVRTYVTKNGKPGVFFLTLDAESRVTCAYAPKFYGLPYRYSKCKLEISKNQYKWNSKRPDDEISLQGKSVPIGPIMQAEHGTLEYFLFERYCLYVEHKGSLKMAYTLHNPWKFQVAEAEISSNSLTESFNLGIENPLKPDYVHVSEGVHVRTWSVELVE